MKTLIYKQICIEGKDEYIQTCRWYDSSRQCSRLASQDTHNQIMRWYFISRFIGYQFSIDFMFTKCGFSGEFGDDLSYHFDVYWLIVNLFTWILINEIIKWICWWLLVILIYLWSRFFMFMWYNLRIPNSVAFLFIRNASFSFFF